MLSDQDVFDYVVKMQVQIEMLKSGIMKDFYADHRQWLNEIIKTISAGDALGVGTKKAVNELVADLLEVEKRFIAPQTKDLIEKLDQVARTTATAEYKLMDEMSPAGVVAYSGRNYAIALAMNSTMSATGQLLEQFVGDWTESRKKKLAETVRKAYASGLTTDDLIRSIRGTKANGYKDGLGVKLMRDADAIARTAVQHTATMGRLATLKRNKHISEQYQWSSTLDSRTTPLCQSLDGRVFTYGKGIMPPAHVRCRSSFIPLPKGEKMFAEGATRSSQFGYVPADQTYYEWLKKQSKEYQEEALGKEWAKQFDKMSAERFGKLRLDKNFRPITLDEFKRKL